jgi:aspartate-semialdehyde dehydrogenase
MKIAIVGATGMVGRTFLKILEEKGYPSSSLTCFASSKSEGVQLPYKEDPLSVKVLNEHSFDEGFDVALFSAGGQASLKYAPLAQAQGCYVIDNSSAFRMDPLIPLVVPEVNAHVLDTMQGKIIANPNCSTIQSVLVLNALKPFGLKRVSYTTYQAVSGSGQQGLDDLERTLLEKPHQFYPQPIAHNVIPLIDVLQDDGYSKEEKKMMFETRKILETPHLKVSALCVRVPVKNAHSVHIQLECDKPCPLDQVISCLNQHPFVKVTDKVVTPREVSGQDVALVTRLHHDVSVDHGLHAFVMADNIRKGAALNAIQILETLIERRILNV